MGPGLLPRLPPLVGQASACLFFFVLPCRGTIYRALFSAPSSLRGLCVESFLFSVPSVPSAASVLILLLTNDPVTPASPHFARSAPFSFRSLFVFPAEQFSCTPGITSRYDWSTNWRGNLISRFANPVEKSCHTRELHRASRRRTVRIRVSMQLPSGYGACEAGCQGQPVLRKVLECLCEACDSL